VTNEFLRKFDSSVLEPKVSGSEEGGGVEVPLSEGLTAGLSKKPSSSASASMSLPAALLLDEVWPSLAELTEAESSVSMSSEGLSVLVVLGRGAKGSLRVLQVEQGMRKRGSIATSPCGPLKMTPQQTFSFVHLDMSKNPETGIDGFRFLTTAGFFLLL